MISSVIRRVLSATLMALLVLGASVPTAALATIPCDQNRPPIIDGFMNPATLIENHHKYAPVEAIILIADDDSGPVTWELVSATSTEPDDGLGQGDKPVDIVPIDRTHFLVRAELGKGSAGRVYTFTYRATDGCGATAETSVAVTVEPRH